MTAGREVPNQITPLAMPTIAAALPPAFKLVTGKQIPRDVLRLAVGKIAGETGNGRSVHNLNLGNIRGTSPEGLYTMFDAPEYENGVKKIVRAPFRAYTSLQASAVDYFRQLQAKPAWWQGLLSGTPEGFVHGLAGWLPGEAPKPGGSKFKYPAYFTADPGEYLKLVKERLGTYGPIADRYAPATAGVAVVAAAGAAAGAAYWWLTKK